MTAIDVRTGFADADGVRIAYEDMGSPDDPAVILIMGFSAQLTLWPLEFCRTLVDGGYRVIRFDNRDIGLSDKFDGIRVEGSLWPRLIRFELGLPSRVPYTLVDMTGDVVGLIEHLGLDSAHVVGASMGGMIAQILAAKYPELVRSLGIIFSSTNQRLLPLPSPFALNSLIAGPGRNPSRDQVLDMIVKSMKIIGSPGYPESDQALRELAAAGYDRCYYPAGVIRQLAAATGTGSLLPYSRRITAPTVVIHGSADPLIRPAGGKAVAKAIQGARLHLIDGMGHDLPTPLHPRLTSLLQENFSRPI